MFETPLSIEEQTKAALAGDSSALGVVFQFYRPRLHAHALRICGNMPVAQDAVQDTFISALTHLQSLRDSAVFYPWLKKILVNRCYRLLRKERTAGFDEEMERKDLLVRQSVEDKFEKAANLQQLYKTLMFLSDELKSCILLRYFSEYNSYEDIAMILGVPVGTVRSRLAAAREKLSALLIRTADSDDAALKEAQQWSGFYSDSWNRIYDDDQTRSTFFNHLIPALRIRFTSGKSGIGRNILEEEVNNDLYFGSRFLPKEIVSSGNLSIMEGPNVNHPDFPDRCAPATSIVIFRKNGKVETLQIFDSTRP
jgi:RNA polymerase sigma factor (sigma-70 family)